MLIRDRATFIRANTRLRAVPHTPSISLYLADEAIALWEKTEEELGELGLPPPFWAFAWAGGQARTYLPRDRLEILATYQVPVTRTLEDTEIKRSSVWRFRPLPAEPGPTIPRARL